MAATIKKSEFEPGDKVIVQGVPYNWETKKATVVTNEYDGEGGSRLVGVKYWYMGEREFKVVDTKQVLKRKGYNVKLSRQAITAGIVIAVVAIIGLWFAGNYNDMVRARNQVSNSRAQIDTELTRRYDLVDNIVASVQGSQAQESDVFGKIAEARKIGSSNKDVTSEQSQQANATLDQQIAFLPRLQENYPELRSNEQVTRLIQELQGTNNTIRDKRNAYNETVTNYNNNITSFPKNIFAGVFDFEKEKLFTATSEERVNPKVDLNRNKENQ